MKTSEMSSAIKPWTRKNAPPLLTDGSAIECNNKLLPILIIPGKLPHCRIPHSTLVVDIVPFSSSYNCRFKSRLYEHWDGNQGI